MAPTCNGLEKVCVVLQVVVTLIVIWALTESTALSVCHKILLQSLLQVQDGSSWLLLCVKPDTQLKFPLWRDEKRRGDLSAPLSMTDHLIPTTVAAQELSEAAAVL